MKALLLPLVLLLVGLGAGVGAGIFLMPEDPPEEMEEAHTDGTEELEDEAGPDPNDPTEFARLSNQFIVPVVKGESVVALVVLSITIEVDVGTTQIVFTQEPKIRDAFLRVLFDHANVGGFDAGFTQAGTMAILRNGLKEASTRVLGTIVHDVLIVDIVRQEV